MFILQNLINLGNNVFENKCFGRLHSRIKKEGAENGFHTVGKDGLFTSSPRVFFPFSDENKIINPDAFSDLGQAVFTDHEALDPGQISLGPVGQDSIEILADHQTKDTVA